MKTLFSLSCRTAALTAALFFALACAEDGHLTASADANSSPWITDITVDEVNGAVIAKHSLQGFLPADPQKIILTTTG